MLREGYATTVEEMSLGACSVAVPIRRGERGRGGARASSYPSLKRDRPRLVAALQVAAQGVGRSLALSFRPVEARLMAGRRAGA